MRTRLIRLTVAVMLVAVVSVGLGQIYAKKPGTGGCFNPKPNCVCPMYYEPVLCDNGCTYSNICVAHCNRASGCEPIGPGPVPL